MNIEPGTENQFDGITADYKTGRRVWREVTSNDYDYSLGVMPPVYVPGGFGVGEAANHEADGATVRTYYVEHGSRYFARDTTKARFCEDRRLLFVALTAETEPAQALA